MAGFGSTKHDFGFMASLGFAEWSPEAVIETLASIGFKSIEWTLAHFDPDRKDQRELNSLVRKTEQAGLIVSDIVVQQDLVCTQRETLERRVRRTERCLRSAADAGVRILNMVSGPFAWEPDAVRVGADLDRQAAWSSFIQALETLLPTAEKLDVVLAVEPAFDMLCRDYDSTQELLGRFDSAHLGITLDPSHLTLYQNDVPDVVRQWGSKIKHVHLKDVVGVPGTPGRDFMFPLLGEGMVDWEGFFAALEQIGYRGCLSVEFESFAYYARILDGDPAKAAALAMELLVKLSNAAHEATHFHHGTAICR